MKIQTVKELKESVAGLHDDTPVTVFSPNGSGKFWVSPSIIIVGDKQKRVRIIDAE